MWHIARPRCGASSSVRSMSERQPVSLRLVWINMLIGLDLLHLNPLRLNQRVFIWSLARPARQVGRVLP